jgi:hypothetical protein
MNSTLERDNELIKPLENLLDLFLYALKNNIANTQ